jgi:hypothetical protein
MILVDTDHFTVLTDSRDAAHVGLAARMRACRGNPALFRRPQATLSIRSPDSPRATLADWELIRWSEPAADQFVALRRQRIRIGTQDLKIAALALANDALLLSANLRDFEQVPGLRVEDWLQR